MKNSGKKWTQRILPTIAMAYALVIIPVFVIYAILAWIVDLKGRVLFFGVAPAAAILLIAYITYLVRPGRFIHFWTDEPTQNN